MFIWPSNPLCKSHGFIFKFVAWLGSHKTEKPVFTSWFLDAGPFSAFFFCRTQKRKNGTTVAVCTTRFPVFQKMPNVDAPLAFLEGIRSQLQNTCIELVLCLCPSLDEIVCQQVKIYCGRRSIQFYLFKVIFTN